jgi:hypothetical protein
VILLAKSPRRDRGTRTLAEQGRRPARRGAAAGFPRARPRPILNSPAVSSPVKAGRGPPAVGGGRWQRPPWLGRFTKSDTNLKMGVGPSAGAESIFMRGGEPQAPDDCWRIPVRGSGSPGIGSTGAADGGVFAAPNPPDGSLQPVPEFASSINSAGGTRPPTRREPSPSGRARRCAGGASPCGRRPHRPPWRAPPRRWGASGASFGPRVGASTRSAAAHGAGLCAFWPNWIKKRRIGLVADDSVGNCVRGD